MGQEKRPRLKRHYSVVAHSPDVVELRHGTWNAISFTLTDDGQSGTLLRVLSRLDGRLSAAELAAAEQVSQSDVESVLEQLAQLGVIEEEPQSALDYYLDHVVPNLAPYGQRRAPSPSSVVLLGDAEVVDEVSRVLGSSAAVGDSEVSLADPELRARLAKGAVSWNGDALHFEQEAALFAQWRDRLVVFAQATLNPLEFRAFNRVSLRHRIPWIHAAVDGPFLLVGPTFLPARSPCYECMEARVRMNLREGASYERYKRALAEGRASRATMPVDAVIRAMLGAHTAAEALNFALTGVSFTVGKFLAIYLPTMEFTFNEVLRLPGCGACAPRPEGDDRELYFELQTLLDGSVSGNGRRGP